MRVVSCRLLLLSFAVTCVSSFVPLSSRRLTNIALFARNKPKAAPSGGGFGSSPAAASKNVKIRSVSGYTGSGTKPLRVAANTFDRLRKEFDTECVNDIYIRSPLNDANTFWFAGKVARCLKDPRGSVIPTPQEACLSQKRLILEYAKHQLRPQNMAGPYSKTLEIWLAPGNSEMNVVQNKISFEKVEGSSSHLREGFDVADVGFNPEIYVGEELQKGGLRVKRDEEGRPIKPVFEVNEPI